MLHCHCSACHVASTNCEARPDCKLGTVTCLLTYSTRSVNIRVVHLHPHAAIVTLLHPLQLSARNAILWAHSMWRLPCGCHVAHQSQRCLPAGGQPCLALLRQRALPTACIRTYVYVYTYIWYPPPPPKPTVETWYLHPNLPRHVCRINHLCKRSRVVQWYLKVLLQSAEDNEDSQTSFQQFFSFLRGFKLI